MTLRFLEVVAEAPDDWYGVLLAPGRMLRADTHTLAHRTVVELREIVGTFGGKVYILSGTRAALFLRKESGGGIVRAQSAINRICRGEALVPIDPTLGLNNDGQAPVQPEAETASLVALYFDLGETFEEFSATLAREMRSADLFGRRLASGLPGDADHAFELTATALARLEAALPAIDLPALLKHQWVCAIMRERDPIRIYQEVFVGIRDLQQVALPDFDLSADRGLFTHLLARLDLRVFEHLARAEGREGTNFGLNIALSNLAHPRFGEIMALYRSLGRQLIVEVQIDELIADPVAWRRAVELVHAVGHKICVDGIAPEALPLIDFGAIEADFLKLRAGPGLAVLVDDTAGQAAIRRAGATRLILSRCESVDQMHAGRRAGIVLFQGWHVDALLAEIDAPPPPG